MLTTIALQSQGRVIPRLAFGTATCPRGQDCSDHLVEALKRGFRHIDTAEDYLNEESVGMALQKWSGDREDIFITTKFGRRDMSAQDPRKSLKRSLKKMGLSYVDLYLIHTPLCVDKAHNLIDLWKAMEELKIEGLAKSIGVSNFLEHHMEEIASHWTGPPSVNQIELSPFCAQDEKHQGIVRSCQKHGVPLSAFTSLAPLFRKVHPPMTSLIKEIGQANGMSDAQVLLAWALQNIDGPLVTITRNPERCDEYLRTLEFKLCQEEIERISEIGKQVALRQYT